MAGLVAKLEIAALEDVPRAAKCQKRGQILPFDRDGDYGRIGSDVPAPPLPRGVKTAI